MAYIVAAEDADNLAGAVELDEEALVKILHKRTRLSAYISILPDTRNEAFPGRDVDRPS